MSYGHNPRDNFVQSGSYISEKEEYAQRGMTSPPISTNIGSSLANYESLLGRLWAAVQGAESLEAALLGARESDTLGKTTGGLTAQPNGHIERIQINNAMFEQALCRLSATLERMSGAL